MGSLKLLKSSCWRAGGLRKGICGSGRNFARGDFLVNAAVDWQIAVLAEMLPDGIAAAAGGEGKEWEKLPIIQPLCGIPAALSQL